MEQARPCNGRSKEESALLALEKDGWNAQGDAKTHVGNRWIFENVNDLVGAEKSGGGPPHSMTLAH